MKTPSFDLRRLRYFHAIALAGSFSAAARSINVAQPALTHQISELERNLGATVFRRTAKGVELTDFGHLLLNHANVILSDVADAEKAIAGFVNASSSHRTIRLGITPTLYDLAPALMTKFAGDLPRITLIVSEARAHDSRELILDGKLDIAITFEENDWPGGMPLGWERMHLVTLPGKHDAGISTVTFEQLSRMDDLIAPIPDTRMRMLLDDASARTGFPLKYALEISGTGPRIQAVFKGFGRTILPLRNVEREYRSGSLDALKIVEPSLDRRIVLYAGDAVKPALLEKLRAFLLPLLGEYAVD